MLDLAALQDQLGAFLAFQEEAYDARKAATEELKRLFGLMANRTDELAAELHTAQPKHLLAGLRDEAPTEAVAAAPRPSPLTVVSTDGSQIFPDRHYEPTCYLLNVSRVAFQYGTEEAPCLESVPKLFFKGKDVEDLVDEVGFLPAEDAVSALRDEWELRELLNLAQMAQVDDRPILAIADGTLIRWMLAKLGNKELEARLIQRYTDNLAGFEEAGIPLCSYISFPANTEVVRLLAFFRDQVLKEPVTIPLEGIRDRLLFELVLKPGERSAIFTSMSRIQSAYPDSQRICYFYVHVALPGGAGEIARVELPAWVAGSADVVNLVHATIISECQKGKGYPMILSEAHEHAVVRTEDRMMFYEMIERQLRQAGRPLEGSMKQVSKRRAMV